MKKIAIITFIFIALLNCTAFAENWQFIASSHSKNYYFDTDSLRYSRSSIWDKTKPIDGLNKNHVTALIKMLHVDAPPTGIHDDDDSDNLKNIGFIIYKNQYDFSAMTCLTSAQYIYDKDGYILLSDENMASQKNIVPSTMDDTIFHAIKDYTANNDAQITQDSKER